MWTTVRAQVGRAIGKGERVIAPGDQPCGPPSSGEPVQVYSPYNSSNVREARR
jgi:hypothetical protein